LEGIFYLYVRVNTATSIIHVAIFGMYNANENNTKNMTFAGAGSKRIIIFILITLKELLNTSIEVTEDSEFTIMSQEINELAQCVEG
jgi:hypothetical protein